MTTARGLHSLELTQKCAQCGIVFQERSNVGRFRCQMHPGPILERDSQGRYFYKCCRAPVGEPTLFLEPDMRPEDRIGCLPCDHSAQASGTAPVVAIFPQFYLQREFITDYSKADVLLTVTSDLLRASLRKTTQPIFAVSTFGHLRDLNLDLVELSFALLANFVTSDFYDMSDVAEFKVLRDRFEGLMDEAMVSSTWDPYRDTTDTSSERISDVTAREVLVSEALYRQYLNPNQQTRRTPASRLAQVKKMQKEENTEKLLDVMVPFVIIRRQALEQDQYSLKTFATNNNRAHPVQQFTVTVTDWMM